MALKYPSIDPIIFRISDQFAISWYSLSYAVGILLGWMIIKIFNKKFNFNYSKNFLDDLMTWAVISIIIGGRLGYVLFYGFNYYLQHPLDILKTWQGGMSFHGGVVGFALAIILLCRKHKISSLSVMDLVSTVAPIGIFFGRIANFINGELYGRVTDSYFGMIFPNSDQLLRHPSQLYEAFFEGMILFIIQMILIFKTKIIKSPGMLSLSFIMQYSIYRFCIEFFREPDLHLGMFGIFTMGQILSIIMIISLFFVIKKSHD
jgi:phosphatidylglycerol---prolipoprotein diacylglyceryl transferase